MRVLTALAVAVPLAACAPTGPAAGPPAATRLVAASAPAAPSPVAAVPVTAPDAYSDLLTGMEECQRPSAAAVTRAHALDDLRVLERLVRGGYAGYDARRDVDWEALFERARADTAALPEPVAVPQLATLWAARIASAGDAHLGISLRGAKLPIKNHHEDAYTADVVLKPTGARWVVHRADDASLQGSVLLACEGVTLREVVRPSALGPPLELVGRVIRLAAQAPAPLACRFAPPRHGAEARTVSLPLRPLRHSTRAEDLAKVPAADVRQGPVPLVRVRKMSGESKGVLAQAAPRLRESPALAVDLRGNPGGGTTGPSRGSRGSRPTRRSHTRATS